MLQESSGSVTPSPTPTPATQEGLPYFTNEITSNGVTLNVGQTTQTILSSDGSPNPETITVRGNEGLSVTPWHVIGSFNVASAYTYIYFTADLSDYSDLKFAGVLNGNGRVPTQFEASCQIGSGAFMSLGTVDVQHAPAVVPAANNEFEFDKPQACEGEASVTFRLKQTASATSNAALSSTSDAGALYILGLGLTDQTGGGANSTPIVPPITPPSTELTAGTYLVSATAGSMAYYLTSTVNNEKLMATTNLLDAYVWELATSSTGWTFKDLASGQYIIFSGSVDGGKTNVNLGTVAEVWTWDASTGCMSSSSISDRCLALRTDNPSGAVFGNYSLQNATQTNYAFALNFIPIT